MSKRPSSSTPSHKAPSLATEASNSSFVSVSEYTPLPTAIRSIPSTMSVASLHSTKSQVSQHSQRSEASINSQSSIHSFPRINSSNQHNQAHEGGEVDSTEGNGGDSDGSGGGYSPVEDSDATQSNSEDSSSDEDPLGITQLNQDFESLIAAIGTRVQNLATQALNSAQYQQSQIIEQISGPSNSSSSSNPNLSVSKGQSPQSVQKKKSSSGLFSRKKEQPLTADEEIRKLKELMKQCDAFELDFMRLKQIGEIVKEFKERIEVIETFMK